MRRKTESRCPAGCCRGEGKVDRREFIAAGGVVADDLRAGRPAGRAAPDGAEGPGTSYVPKVKVCFVRRKGEYGMRWPGRSTTARPARKKYTTRSPQPAKSSTSSSTCARPIYSHAEADAWIAEAMAEKPDGLLVVLLDRQEHAWPTATRPSTRRSPPSSSRRSAPRSPTNTAVLRRSRAASSPRPTTSARSTGA